MKSRPTAVFACATLLLLVMNVPLNAQVCSNTWTSSDPGVIYSGSTAWQQNVPVSCGAGCAKISVTILVHNYNDVGTLDLFASNTNVIEYGNPYYERKMGWIGRINVPLGSGWRTVTFPLRLPHLEWLNDNGSIYFSLQGPEYFSGGVRAQFQVASATIQTIPWKADIDVDGDIDGSDLAGLIVNYGCSGTCPADFDGDGVVNDNDLVAFAAEFSGFQCPLGFYESFSDGTANNFIRTAVWTVADGVFKMTGIQPTQSYIQYAYYDKTYENFSFEASVKQIQGGQGNASGLYFRSNSGITSGYLFLIAAAGVYEILESVSGNLTPLVSWTSSDTIKAGYNVWNRLRVTCNGSTLKFYINGVLVQTLTDTSASSGVAGLMAVDSNAALNIFHFDDVLLEQK